MKKSWQNIAPSMIGEFVVVGGGGLFVCFNFENNGSKFGSFHVM